MQVSGAVTNGQFNPNTVTYRDSFRVTPISPFAPFASFDADNLTPTTYDTVAFTSNAFLSSHAWTFNPTTVTYVNGTSNSSRTPEVVFNAPGVYDVSLAVANNFGSDDTTTLAYITVTQGVNTANLIETNNFKIYPNPTADILNLEYTLSKSEVVNISMHDLQGRQVALLASKTQPFGNQKATFNLANYNLTKGIYLVKMTIGEGTQWFKILVE
jgi:PKD repeat protein